jgi:hypothetical protein
MEKPLSEDLQSSLRQKNYGPNSEDIHVRGGGRAEVDWPDHHGRDPGRGYLEPDCVGHEQPGSAVAGGCDGAIFGITELFHPAAV